MRLPLVMCEQPQVHIVQFYETYCDEVKFRSGEPSIQGKGLSCVKLDEEGLASTTVVLRPVVQTYREPHKS